MKSTHLLVLFISLLGGSQLLAKPVDLSEFPGSFTGTTTLVYSGSVYTGASVMKFTVPKKGRSGSLQITANITVGGVSEDMSNSYQFAKNKVLSISKLAAPIAPVAVSGTFAASKKTISGTAVYSGATINVTVSIKKTKKRATLTVVHSVISGGAEVYRATYVGTGKIKK